MHTTRICPYVLVIKAAIRQVAHWNIVAVVNSEMSPTSPNNAITRAEQLGQNNV